MFTDSIPKYRVLVADDEPGVRESMAMLLIATGYEVSTAQHGLDALRQLRSQPIPDVIVSDLAMPQMSGFELLSVVRRRFPEIAVLAVSGAYDALNFIPGGVIADAFYAKGANHPEELSRIVGELIKTSAMRAANHREHSVPIWIPKNGKDSRGIPFIVLTCTDCLRSFPISVTDEDAGKEIQEASCLFCVNTMRYIIDTSSTASCLNHAITVDANTKKYRQQ